MGFTVILLLGPSALLAETNYYVDAGNVSPYAPYTNWATASTNMQRVLNSAGRGDMVHVASATYRENITNNGTTLLGGYPAGGGIRDPLANETRIVSATNLVVTMLSYSTLNGFIIDGETTAFVGVKIAEGSTYVTIRNNVVKNIIKTKGLYESGITVGGGASDASNFLIEENQIHDCRQGITIRGKSASTGVCKVMNNNVYSNTQAGIDLDYSSNPSLMIINNTIRGNGMGISGSVAGGGILIKDLIIWANSTALSGMEGLYLDYCDIQAAWPGLNINQDPCFVDLVSFRLSSNSPCINPGNGYTEMGRYGNKGLTIADAATYSSSATVTLNIVSNAPTWSTNAAYMKFSNNGTDWSPVEIFSTNKSWDITDPAYGGDGSEGFKTIYFQPCSDAGGTPVTRINGGSTMVSDTIQYITQKTVKNFNTASTYYTIQSAIDAASSGNVIEVQSSRIYYENVIMAGGNNLTLRSQDGTTPTISSGSGYVVDIRNSSTLEGFIIDAQHTAVRCITISGTGATVKDNSAKNAYGGAIGLYITGINATGAGAFLIARNTVYGCWNGMTIRGSSGICAVRNNLIYSNLERGLDLEYNSNPSITVEINTIYGNKYGALGGNGGNCVLKNCIFWNNTTEFSSMGSMVIRYCDIRGGYAGVGNIDQNPLFVSTVAGNEDFHLKSRGGTKVGGITWTKFPTNSPCIDAGDPADDYSNEPMNNGHRINMGGYGNTPEASKIPSQGTIFIIK